MNDVPSIAQQARANLAQALSALQEDNVPPQTQALAGVVAEAMNLLHRIEKNYGNTGFDCRDHSTRALLLVRNALNNLQAPENSHPTLDGVLEPAAHAVGLVHQLNQVAAREEAKAASSSELTPTDSVSASQATEGTRQQREMDALLAPLPSTAEVTTPESAAAPSEVPSPESLRSADTAQAPGPPPGTDYATNAVPGSVRLTSVQVSNSTEPVDPAIDDRSSTTPVPQHASFAASPERVSSNPERISTNPDRISTNPVSLPGLDPLPNEVYIEVSLGAYSTSNFYRRMIKSDVVDNGGLFVASYTPPELTQNIRIRAKLTGGFEFEGRGTVEWRREMPKSGSLNPLTPPGFGVKFTELSADARKMVVRYSRAREPFLRDADAT